MTKKILAVLLALAMMFSLFTVNVFAADEVELETLFTKTIEDGYTGSWSTILPQSETAAFIEACEAEDSVVTITVPGVEFTWAQFILQSSEFGTGLQVDGGHTEGSVYTVSGAAVVESWNENKITEGTWYQICFQGTPIDPETSDLTIEVKAPKKEGSETPEGTKVSLSSNDPYNWAGAIMWEDIEASLKDIAPEALADIDSVEVAFTVTGAVVDGEVLPASKVGANLVLQGKWEGWHSVEAAIATDGNYKITLKPSNYDLDKDSVKAYQLISQVYVDPDDLPNGMDGTKTAAVYYKDAKVTVNKKSAEDEPSEDVPGTINLITDGIGLTGTDFKGPKIAWNSAAIDNTCKEWADFQKALKDPEAKFVLTYTITGEPTGDDYGWFNFFMAGGQAVPNYSTAAAEFVDVVDGVQASNQWSLLHAGKHVVTYSLAKWQEALEAAGATDITNVAFQSGLTEKLSVSFESLVVVTGGTTDKPSEDEPSEDEPEVPSDAKIPSGYKAIKTITGGKVTFPEDEYNKGSANGTLVTLVQSEYNLTEDDYIYFSITPSANLTKYKVAGQVQNTSWGSDWKGVTGGDNVNSVGFYLKDVLAINPSVPLAQLQQVLLQVWDGEIGDSVEDYTVVIARKSEEPIKPGDATVEEVVYSMEHTDGQYFENKPLKGGLKLEKDDSSDQMCRIATNWVNGGTVYNAIINALKSSNGNLKITYTGDFEGLSLQYAIDDDSAAMIDIETDSFTITEVDGKKVASIPVADVLKAFADGIAGTGWKNLIMVYGDEMTLYAFEITNLKSANVPAVIPDKYKEVPVTLTKTTEDGKTVLTPDSELMVDELVIPFKNVAPADGKVTVYYGVPGQPYAEIKDTQESLNITSPVDKILVKCTWETPAGKSVKVNGLYYIDASGKETALEVKTEAELSAGGGLVASAMLPETVESGSLKVRIDATVGGKDVVLRYYGIYNSNGDHNLSDVAVFNAADKEIVPDSKFETYTANFKAGDSYVVVKVNGKKAITKIEIEPETVEVTGKVMVPADEDNTPFGYAIQTGNNKYHGFRIGPFMISMPHRFVNGICPICHQRAPKTTDVSSLIEADEDEAETVSEPAPKKPTYEASEDALYVLETTGGQNFEDVIIAGGADLVTSDGRTRLATSWVNGGAVYNDLIKALQDNEDAVIRITYTGTITAFGIESENAGIIDVECEVTEGDEFNTMTCNVADFLETAKKAIEDTSWRNVYLVAEDGAVLYGFEIVAAE